MRVFVILLLSIALAGCQSTGPKTRAGAGIGAAAGAIIGAATGGRNRGRNAAIGAAIGAVAGGTIGAFLDAEDRKRKQAAIDRSLLTGSVTAWRNPQSGAAGVVRPTNISVQPDGRRCSNIQFIDRKNGVERSGSSPQCISRV